MYAPLLVRFLIILLRDLSIRKLSDSCGKQWEEHWQCLELHNQVSRQQLQLSKHPGSRTHLPSKELYMCRKPERTLNQCVFEKLVSIVEMLFSCLVASWQRGSGRSRIADVVKTPTWPFDVLL